MTDHVAIAIAKIEGSTVTDDGSHALFEFSTVKDETVTIAVPTNELFEFMALASQAMAVAQKILQADPNMKYILPMEWWNIWPHSDGRHVVLSFQLKGGSELSFQVDRGAAQNMRETLGVLLGDVSSPENTDTTKH